MRITWLVSGLEVPNVGVATVGDSIIVADDVATSLIAQGLAVNAAPLTNQKKSIKAEGGV